LKTFLKAEDIRADDGFFCENCNDIRNERYRLHFIGNSPQTMFINLKCFEYDQINQRTVKIPYELDLDEDVYVYAVDQVAQHETKIYYQLYGVVIHQGSNANSGHYFVLVRNPTYPDCWYKISDQEITKITFDEAKKIATTERNSPYILMLTLPQSTNFPMIKRNILQEVSVYDQEHDDSILIQ
jgi:ubiquitin C-terminal hydrolase